MKKNTLLVNIFHNFVYYKQSWNTPAMASGVGSWLNKNVHTLAKEYLLNHKIIGALCFCMLTVFSQFSTFSRGCPGANFFFNKYNHLNANCVYSGLLCFTFHLVWLSEKRMKYIHKCKKSGYFYRGLYLLVTNDS